MRESKASYVAPDEVFDELVAGSMPFVFRHSFPLQEGAVNITYVTDSAAKLVSAYYDSSFDESMALREYLELVGLIKAEEII
jgi:hypothetical protein